MKWFKFDRPHLSRGIVVRTLDFALFRSENRYRAKPVFTDHIWLK